MLTLSRTCELESAEAYWSDRKVLVTGAGGFIGSHLAERLVTLGAQVRAMVHYSSKGSWGWMQESPAQDKVEIIAGDVVDCDFVRRAMRDIETVFHLAGLVSVPYSYAAPLSYVRTNIEGTLNVLQTATDAEVPRIVLTSTSEVYGTARYVPMDEGHPLQGQSPYSASKIATDKLGEAFHLSFGSPVVTVRPFNAYGPRQSSRAIVPTIICQCLTGEPVRLGNLLPTRDLNFVTDIVEGFVLAGASDQTVGTVTNIGSGREISVGDLAEKIASITGVPLRIEHEEQRERPGGSEVTRLCADNTRARNVLGWASQVSLDEGLRRTVDWFKTHPDYSSPRRYAV